MPRSNLIQYKNITTKKKKKKLALSINLKHVNDEINHKLCQFLNIFKNFYRKKFLTARTNNDFSIYLINLLKTEMHQMSLLNAESAGVLVK